MLLLLLVLVLEPVLVPVKVLEEAPARWLDKCLHC